MKTLLLLLLLNLFSSSLFASSKTKVSGNFHMTLYQNTFGEVSEFEMFTKVEDKEIYMGLSCVDMTPFPTLKIVLIGDEVIATLSKKYIPVDYEIITKNSTIRNPIVLEASLKSTYDNEQFSNLIRFQVNTGKIKNIKDMQNLYQTLLNSLKEGSEIKFYLQKNELEDIDYTFSLKGLKSLLLPHESLCK